MTALNETAIEYGELLRDADAIIVERTDHGVSAVVLHATGGESPLPHAILHSPSGFEFGYGGSGPADLALAILRACLPAEDAMIWHQNFKWTVVAFETRRIWHTTAAQVRDWHRRIAAAAGTTTGPADPASIPAGPDGPQAGEAGPDGAAKEESAP
jgi:hypothetical protein